MNNTEDGNPISNKSNRSGTANFGAPFQPNHGLAVIFWIIFVVGLVGNLFLLSVNFWRRRSNQTATEMFMVSLSIFDIGLILGSTWINAMVSVNPSFDLGRVMCKICNLWSGLAADGSVVTLSVIGVDRYSFYSIQFNSIQFNSIQFNSKQIFARANL